MQQIFSNGGWLSNCILNYQSKMGLRRLIFYPYVYFKVDFQLGQMHYLLFQNIILIKQQREIIKKNMILQTQHEQTLNISNQPRISYEEENYKIKNCQIPEENSKDFFILKFSKNKIMKFWIILLLFSAIIALFFLFAPSFFTLKMVSQKFIYQKKQKLSNDMTMLAIKKTINNFPQEANGKKIQQIQKQIYASGSYQKQSMTKKKHIIYSSSMEPYRLSWLVKQIGTAINDQGQPSIRSNIQENGPYQQLPFCILVEHSSVDLISDQILKSILRQRYSQITTIIYGEIDQESRNKHSQFLSQSHNNANPFKGKFYRLNVSKLNYYQYRQAIHEICPQHSLLMFATYPLQSDSLVNLNNIHQYYPIHMTYSQDMKSSRVHSFSMKLFDAITTNDFYLSNAIKMEQQNQEKFYCLALMELGAKVTKKIQLKQFFLAEEINRSGTTIIKSDQTIYTRIPYQSIFSLSQSISMNISSIGNILKALNSKKFSKNTTEKSNAVKLLNAIQYQDILDMPASFSMNRKLLKQRINKYNLYETYYSEKTEFCLTVIEGNQAQGKINSNYMRNLESILNQKYSKFRIIYFDDGKDAQINQQIDQLIKKFDFGQKFLKVKNLKRKGPTFNIIQAAFQFCHTHQLQVVIDSQAVIIDPHYLSMINSIKMGNPEAWMIYSSMKTDTHQLGYSYQLYNDHEYRSFKNRVKNLNYLSPIFAVQVRLLRSIPLSYHLTKEKQWINHCWMEALGHSIVEKSTTAHIQFIDEIEFSIPESYLTTSKEFCEGSSEKQQIEANKFLKPFLQIGANQQRFEQQIRRQLKSHLLNSTLEYNQI